MGRVKETALFKKVEKNCGMSLEMHQDMEGCCEDELILRKVEDEQQITSAKQLPATSYNLLYEIHFSEFVAILTSQEDDVEEKNQSASVHLMSHNCTAWRVTAAAIDLVTGNRT